MKGGLNPFATSDVHHGVFGTVCKLFFFLLLVGWNASCILELEGSGRLGVNSCLRE